jgi:hypothetical protein
MAPLVDARRQVKTKAKSQRRVPQELKSLGDDDHDDEFILHCLLISMLHSFIINL